MWSLHQEQLTTGQWSLIGFLTLLLLFAINFIPNDTILIYVMKVLFGYVTLLVVYLIFKLDRFLLFKDDYGRVSSIDVIHIIEGKK